MSKVQRGEKLLTSLASEGKITPTGKDWLIAALDPFHDNQLSNLEGWPDVECGASVVRQIKKSVQLSVPVTVAPGANWDAHIVIWPMLEHAAMNQSLDRINNFYVGPQIPVPVSALVGGVQAYGMPTGANLDIMQNAGSTATIGQIALDPVYTKGAGRLVGMGVEIHNTTAELTRQGACCVYRQMANARDPSSFTGQALGATPYIQNFTAPTLRYPPQNTEEAMLIQGSRQWTAEEGAYQVVAFCADENPAYPISTSAVVISSPGADDEEGDVNTMPIYVPLAQPVSPAGHSHSMVRPIRVHPIHQSGIILTGLSNTSTLTMNVNYFYESFPGQSDPGTLALAKPSAKYDPCALEIYSRVLQSLPVGVPVRENGLGDWFFDAASKAAKYIGPVLAALPHPIAKGAGAALSYFGDTAKEHQKKPRKPKERQIQPPNSWERDTDWELVPEAPRSRPHRQPDWNTPNQPKKKKPTKRRVAKARAPKPRR